MRNERAFSRNGFYKFVLDANLMLHDNVARAGRKELNQWLSTRQADTRDHALKILDLACGGAPVSVCHMTEELDSTFDYTGIDINPDQIESAREFQYPSNYSSVELLEGNAWDFLDLLNNKSFDIVFSGMNIHHGTPDELRHLLRQIKQTLSPKGIFLSHDFFRPPMFEYLARPTHDATTGESFAMVPPEKLSALKNESSIAVATIPQTVPDWRDVFIAKYRIALAERGAQSEQIEQIMSHVAQRDYPVSIDELKQLSAEAGIPMRQVELDSDSEPMHGYFCMMSSGV